MLLHFCCELTLILGLKYEINNDLREREVGLLGGEDGDLNVLVGVRPHEHFLGHLAVSSYQHYQ